MEVDDLDPADAYFARAAETAKTLSAGRVKREPPADLASPDAWRDASEVPAITSLHMTTKPGINTLDIDAAGTLLLTGGMDNHAQVYSRTTDHVLGTLKGHTKRITAALFSSGIGAAKGIVTASADKSVRVWTAKPANAEADGDVRSMGWIKKAIIKHHKAEVVGLAMHPGSSSQYFASAAADGAWAVHLAESGAVVVSGSIDAHISCIAYHPDGAFLGLGTTDGFAKIFDLKQQQVLATLDTETDGKPITTLQFSENGYYLATVTSENVAIWDLRKQKKSHQWGPTDLTPDAGGAFVDARFDRSGKYFAIAMPNAIHVFRVKGWISLVVLPCDDSIQTVQWVGQLSTAIVAACLENSLHIYEASSSSASSQ
ncbi:hypothetical protein GGI00_000702 [Coemansia sp. RSA 2681]|nr:hypothetical protein GGI00_000702 [Coemansia sp. RSA 2681]